MNMEFHRWWSILLYRGHVPLSPFLYLSNPFLTFRFYFIFCYLHVCVFPQIIRCSIEIPILSFFLSCSSFLPCISMQSVLQCDAQAEISRFIHTEKYIHSRVQSKSSQSACHVAYYRCPVSVEIEVSLASRDRAFKLWNLSLYRSSRVAVLYRSDDATRHWRVTESRFCDIEVHLRVAHIVAVSFELLLFPIFSNYCLSSYYLRVSLAFVE